jgi:hypothetical protein
MRSSGLEKLPRARGKGKSAASESKFTRLNGGIDPGPPDWKTGYLIFSRYLAYDRDHGRSCSFNSSRIARA